MYFPPYLLPTAASHHDRAFINDLCRLMGEGGEAPPDEILVVAAILGDLEAFNELVLRYRAAVVRTAQALAGPNDAEDVAQEALLLAFKALPSIEDPTRFAAWLMAITRHRALRSRLQDRRRRDTYVELDALLLERVAALSAPYLPDVETREELETALRHLPEDYALVLRLHYLDAMPQKRIAAFLGISLSTVKWRVYHGKKLMRAELDRLNPLTSHETYLD